MKTEDMKKLHSPGAAYRAKPFWSWNGKLDEKELKFQIDVMKEMGFGGFFMHSRTGLETEYMGEEWFSLIRSCSEYAASLGLEAWLYDEDRWPSGTCGGIVTQKRENRMRFISEYRFDEEAEACPDVERIIARYAVRLDGDGRLSGCKKVSCKSEVPEGYTYAVYAEELMKCTGFYNDSAYLDTMNENAVEEYLRSTHDRYAEKLGDLLGKKLKGIFCDEPHRGEILNGFGITNENQFAMIPFTDKVFGAFYEKYGREVCIPRIYYGKSGEATNDEAAAYIDVLDDLFVRSFARKYQERCKKYGLTFTGHILHEDELSSQAAMSGSMMRFYEYMDYPGIDNLTAHNDCYWAAIQCASVARQLEKPFVLSELYGCTGWDVPLREYKRIGDWQALFGVNLRCPHLSWYTMAGETKRDYPASILHQNAWYKDWDLLETYFGRIGMILSGGERKADLLVIHPVEQMWKLVRKGWLYALTPKIPEVERLNKLFEAQCKELIAACVEFDYGDEELMAKYASVGSDETGAYLKVGAAVYRTVMVAEWQTVREGTAELIRKFEKAGGRVVAAAGELSRGDIVSAPEGTACAIRTFDGEKWLFVLNLTANETAGALVLAETLKDFCAEEWDMVGLESLGRRSLSDLTLAAGQMRVFRLSKEKSSFVSETEKEEIVLPEKMPYKLGEPNVLVLDKARCFLDGDVFCKDPTEVLRIDRKLRDKFSLTYRGGEMVQPWYAEKFGMNANGVCGKVRLVYTFDSDIECEAEIAAEYDNISCNGIAAEKTGRRWVDGCYTVYGASVKKGRNEISAEIKFCRESNIEAIFLLGEFALSPSYRVRALPNALATENIQAQGFPFYSGSICYKTGVTGGRIKVSAESLNGTTLHIHGGKTEKTLAFIPFEVYTDLVRELELELFFTRRNTFGPFHLKRQPAEAYGPFSFVSTGDEWTEDYVLISQGFRCKIYKIKEK